jgi:thioredoxin reductase (NADPH)/alkyl hydroperoxide reductase subunit F
VLIATGAEPLRLEVPGEERFADHGLGYSISTYAHLAAGRRVAVIGASERTLNGTLELARTAERVFLLAPQTLDEQSQLVGTLRQRPNVEVLESCRVTEIAGRTSADTVVFVRDGQTQQLPVHGVFVTLGLSPNSAMVASLVERDAHNFIRVTSAHETSVAGLFAAGDVTTDACENVLIAIGDGVRAARSAYAYLLTQHPVPHADAGG